MRIAFFDPPPKHFDRPCPRCGNVLTQQIRNKYELENPRAKETIEQWPQETPETVIPAPTPLCRCCEFFKGDSQNKGYCKWCDDCPTEYCDVPKKEFKKG